MKQDKYIKSPLCYQGGKYRLLDKILPLFPQSGHKTFIDLFGGGFNVGININADKIVYNDTCTPVVDLLSNLYRTKNCISLIDKKIEEYGLTKDNLDAYLRLRDDYNKGKNKSWIQFYTIICFCYNNGIRFNKKGEFNYHFGYRDFNEQLRYRFNRFVEEIQKKDIDFLNVDFRQIEPNQGCFVYCDPPYMLSNATYNKEWNDEMSKSLLKYLDKLDNKGIKWALSEVLSTKDKTNEILLDWSKKYKVEHLNMSYENCNVQRKKYKSKDDEVLIMNYS